MADSVRRGIVDDISEVAEKMTCRNLNVEVLRSFLMLVIVIYHASNNGPFQIPNQYSETKVVSWVMTWATDAFVFISGWYGIHFSWRRFFRFLGYGVYAAVVLFLISKCALGRWYFTFTLGWFGNSYMALMLMAPFVNASLDGLYDKSPALLRQAWIGYTAAMLLSWMPVGWLGCSLTVAGWFGHSFNTLLYVYVTAYVLRRWMWFQNLQRNHAAGWFVLIVTIHVGLIGLTCVNHWCKTYIRNALDFDSPTVIGMCALIFVVFAKTNFPVRLQKVCGWMGGSMFTVYLLHASRVGRVVYNMFVADLAEWFGGMAVSRIAAIFAGGIICFCVCLALDLIRRVFGMSAEFFASKMSMRRL